MHMQEKCEKPERSLTAYLEKRQVDKIADDKEFMLEEYDAVIEYCESCDYILNDNDYAVIVSRGLEDSFDCLKQIYIKDLWLGFGDVPMNPETEEIETEWHGFPAGTHREVIWEWFEDAFNISVAEDLMFQEKQAAVWIAVKKSLCVSKLCNVTESQLEQLRRGENPFYREMLIEADEAKGAVTVEDELYDYCVTGLDGSPIVDWSY